MAKHLIRDETFAIVNAENRVRILLDSPTTAARLAESLGKASPTMAPYRVVRVLVEELPT